MTDQERLSRLQRIEHDLAFSDTEIARLKSALKIENERFEGFVNEMRYIVWQDGNPELFDAQTGEVKEKDDTTMSIHTGEGEKIFDGTLKEFKDRTNSAIHRMKGGRAHA